MPVYSSRQGLKHVRKHLKKRMLILTLSWIRPPWSHCAEKGNSQPEVFMSCLQLNITHALLSQASCFSEKLWNWSCRRKLRNQPQRCFKKKDSITPLKSRDIDSLIIFSPLARSIVNPQMFAKEWLKGEKTSEDKKNRIFSLVLSLSRPTERDFPFDFIFWMTKTGFEDDPSTFWHISGWTFWFILRKQEGL